MSSSLCPTCQAMVRVLDGASERALLISDDGLVLHRNGAADHFLYKNPSGTTMITEIMVCPENEDWKTIPRSRMIKWDGVSTRSERNIQWVVFDSDGATYHVAYICSKHERVREVVDHAFDPVITANVNGVIVTANDAACTLFEYPEGELVGANLSKLCTEEDAKHHDMYVQRYNETGQKKIIGVRREVMARKKSGAVFPCELGIQEIKDVSTGKKFFCGFFKDLTLLKEHEAAIKERQALMQGMINASFDSMFEINQYGIIKIVNDAACSFFGYTREELIGSNISIICGGGDDKKHAAYMERYLRTGQKRIIGRKRQVKARRKDGSEIEVELGVQEVTLKNGELAFCGYIRDLTAQKQDKRALRKQQRLIHGKFFGTEIAEEDIADGDSIVTA